MKRKINECFRGTFPCLILPDRLEDVRTEARWDSFVYGLNHASTAIASILAIANSVGDAKGLSETAITVFFGSLVCDLLVSIYSKSKLVTALRGAADANEERDLNCCNTWVSHMATPLFGTSLGALAGSIGFFATSGSLKTVLTAAAPIISDVFTSTASSTTDAEIAAYGAL